MDIRIPNRNIRMDSKIMMVVLLFLIKGLSVTSNENIKEKVMRYYTNENNEIFNMMKDKRIRQLQQANGEDQKITDMKQNKSKEEHNEKKKEIHPVIAALYIRYLAFWLAVNFRVGTVYLSSTCKLNFTNNCNNKFTKLRKFVTTYYQKEIEDYVKNLKDNNNNTYSDRATSAIVVTLSKLTLDFVEEDTSLTKKKSSSFLKNVIQNFKAEDIVKSSKTIFPYAIDDSITNTTRSANKIYAELYEKVRGVINMRKVKKVQNYFSELLLDKSKGTRTIVMKHYVFPTFSLSKTLWYGNKNNIEHNGDTDDEFLEQLNLIQYWRQKTAREYEN